MSEYIDKKALLDEICRDNCERSYDGTCHNCRMTETIADFPAADVAPIVYGKWIIPHWRNSTYCAYCSVCGEEAQYGEYKGVQKYYKFCPYCGAKIDTK